MLNYSSWIEIDLKQFKKNINIIRSYIKDTKLCLAVKANAYGHGILELSKVAQRENVDYLAVANFLEGIKLRKANVSLPILVLGTFHDDQIKDLIDNDLEITISSYFKANILKEYCLRHNKTCKVHLKVDTGMHRIGVRPATALELYKFLKNEKCFIIKGIFSHFACAETLNHPMNDIQYSEFDNFLSKIDTEGIICHLFNSGALCNLDRPFKDMVRLGALALGCYSIDLPEKFKDIKSIFSVKSRVSFFKVVEKNEGVSYSHTYITKDKTRILTIPIGYGDGYPRALTNKGQVLIRGKKYPIVGTICMDQLMVDIGNDSAFIGDEVVLIGNQDSSRIDIKDVASLCNTISYDILCSFNERLPRVYVE